MTKKAAQFRRFCFSAFGENMDLNMFPIREKCSYFGYGVEIAPSTGNPHWQGYFETTKKMTSNSVKKLLPKIYFTPCVGTQAQNTDYIAKDEGEFYEEGELMAQGTRTDLNAIRQQIDAGISDKEIAQEHFGKWCQYGRRFEDYRRLMQPARDWVTEVHVIWGKSGTGKTRQAIAAGAVPMSFHNGFMAGYKNDPIVLWDDFDGTSIDRQLFLQLTDRYPMVGNVKGGEITWNPKQIYITSNTNPKDWYVNNEAVARRLTTSTHIL